MREIKFRAWDSRNEEVVYSEYSDCFYINTKGVLFMYAIPKSESGAETIYHKSYTVDQFTGLQDKNGVDIYEGDIVSMPIDGEFFDTEIKFTVDRDFNGWEITPQDTENGAIVIGNIYEDKGLLK